MARVVRDPVGHKAKLLIALERSLGIVTPACKEVGVTRKTFYVYYNSDMDFRKAVDDINDVTLDFVENQLLRKIKDGSERSILFYMKYRGRNRGYSERIDITSGDMPIIDISKMFGFDDDKTE